MIGPDERAALTEPERAIQASPIATVYAARALRDFGDGFVAVLLPVYLTALGLGAFEVGLVATLADIVGGRIAMVGLDEHSLVVTSDMTIHYLGPVKTTAHAVGHVLRRGQRAVVVRVEVYDERDGPLAAAVQLAFTVITPRS